MYKKICLGIIALLLTTGCMKENFEISIDKNKKMTVSMIAAVSDELKNMNFGEGESEETSTFDVNSLSEDEKATYDRLGITYEEYKEDGYTGMKLVRTFKDIDKLSTKEGKTDDLSTLFEDNAQIPKYFIVKETFFKNTYKAVFKSADVNDNNSNMGDMSDYSDDDLSSLGISKEEMEKMMEGMEVNFVLHLPDRSISNNATNVSADGKTLTWDLLKDKDKETIEFEFELYNITYYVSLIGGGIVLVLLVLFAIFKTRKKKEPEMVTNYEPKEEDLKVVNLDTNLDDTETLSI